MIFFARKGAKAGTKSLHFAIAIVQFQKTMKPVKVLVVEDDLIIAASLEERLQRQGYEVIGPASDSDAALRLFYESRPDIALLDIELKGSPLDGIELSNALYRSSPLPILFLTSYDERRFVERAKQAPMVHYLLKSAPPEQLLIALDTAFAAFYNRRPVEAPLKPSPPCPLYTAQECFFVKQGHRHLRIEIADIRWVESMGSLVRIVTDEKAFTFSVKLKSFLEQVPHPDLVRTHRSWVANIRHVTGYNRGQVEVRFRQGAEAIPLSEGYRAAFLSMVPGLKAD